MPDLHAEDRLEGEKGTSAVHTHSFVHVLTLVVVVKDSPIVVPYQEMCCTCVGREEKYLGSWTLQYSTNLRHVSEKRQ